MDKAKILHDAQAKLQRHYSIHFLMLSSTLRACSMSSSDHIRPVELVLESNTIGGAFIFPLRINSRRFARSIPRSLATSCVFILADIRVSLAICVYAALCTHRTSFDLL